MNKDTTKLYSQRKITNTFHYALCPRCSRGNELECEYDSTGKEQQNECTMLWTKYVQKLEQIAFERDMDILDILSILKAEKKQASMEDALLYKELIKLFYQIASGER